MFLTDGVKSRTRLALSVASLLCLGDVDGCGASDLMKEEQVLRRCRSACMVSTNAKFSALHSEGCVQIVVAQNRNSTERGIKFRNSSDNDHF